MNPSFHRYQVAAERAAILARSTAPASQKESAHQSSRLALLAYAATCQDSAGWLNAPSPRVCMVRAS